MGNKLKMRFFLITIIYLNLKYGHGENFQFGKKIGLEGYDSLDKEVVNVALQPKYGDGDLELTGAVEDYSYSMQDFQKVNDISFMYWSKKKKGMANCPRLHEITQTIANITISRGISSSGIVKLQSAGIKLLDYFSMDIRTYMLINRTLNSFLIILQGKTRGIMSKEFKTMIEHILWPAAIFVKPLIIIATVLKQLIILWKIINSRQELTKKQKFDGMLEFYKLAFDIL